jgi:hypothetical protein
MKRPKPRRFVPRGVLGMAIVGVVPACAIQACGGADFSAADGGEESSSGGVAVDAFGPGVAATCFTLPQGCPDVRKGVADAAFGVADTGFRHDANDTRDAGDINDVNHDIRDSPVRDIILAVAFIGFVDLEESEKRLA